LDAYDGLGEVPAHLTDVDFMQACAAALAPGGLLVANLFNGPQGSPERRVVEEFAMQMAQTVGPVCTFKVCVCVREREAC
jgi:spermidine synthase